MFRRHQREIFAYFLRMVRRHHDAEELTQETFVRACSAALRFRGSSSVRTWLFGIAHRVLLEASRAGLFDRPPAFDPDRASPDPASNADQRIDLERALASLGPSDREVVVIVDMLGFTPSEGAALLGISPEAFRVRLHRARTRLREVVGR